jgi:hypothetical protein
LVIQVKTPETDMYKPMNDHAKNILRLLESGDKTDVSFNVRGEIFRAYSQILYAKGV